MTTAPVEDKPPDEPEDDEPERREPPDGTISTCRQGGACGNEIQYNAAKQRWEHTGRGHAACFGK